MGLAAALAYGAVSTAMTFTNKSLFAVYEFRLEYVILLLQMLVAPPLLALTEPRSIPELRKQPLSMAPLLAVAVLHTVSVACALAALGALSVPVYSTLKRLTSVVVLVGERVVLGKTAPPAVVACVLVMVVGALMTGSGDLLFDPTGYALAGVAIVAQAGYLVSVARATRVTGLDSTGIMYCTALLSLPLLALLAIASGQLEAAAASANWRDPGFVLVLVVTLLQGVALNYTMFWCTTSNSALTTTIVGQIKIAVTVVAGFFVFGGAPMDAVGLVGVGINTVGGLAYGAVKARQARAKRPEL